MSILFDLPKSDQDKAAALNLAIRPGMRTRNIASVEWWLIHYYMMGARNFNVLSWDRGTVRVAFETQEGEIDFRWEDILHQFQTEMGRLGKIDIHPAVGWEGTSLGALRNSGIAQAALNAKVSRLDLEAAQNRLTRVLAKYGTAGLAIWENHRREPGAPTPQIEGAPGIDYEFEIVPPWQLLCIPDDPQTLEDVRAIVRQRQVPVHWLRQQPFFEVPQDDTKLHARSTPLAHTPVVSGPGGGETASAAVFGLDNPMSPREGSGRKKGREDFAWERVATLNEVYVLGPENTCAAYYALAGDVLLNKQEYYAAGERRVHPIPMVRYLDIDSFYGRGFVSRIIGLNNEVEKMLRNLFENVQDMDEFGFLMIPDNIGINKRSLKKTSKPRHIFYSSDYSVPENKPYVLDPATTGDFPGRVAQMATALQQKISGQSDLFSGEAPGRTDSAAAMGFLFETNAIPLSVPANEIKRGFSQVYASLLQSIRRNYREGDALLLSTVDDSVAGVILDPTTGQMRLDRNPIPEPWDIKIGIRDTMPRPKEQRKGELVQMLQLGIITPMEFRIINYREDMGFPVGNKAEWEAYQKAIFQNIIMFGDGETPGTAIQNTAFDNSDVHLFAITDFTSKIQFSLASRKVREVFEERIMFLENMKGNFPDQLPREEDMAEQQQQMLPPEPQPGIM